MELSTLKRLTRCTERYLREKDGTYPEIKLTMRLMQDCHPGHSERWYILATHCYLGPDL